MNNEPVVKQIDGWTVRMRKPDGPGPHPVMVIVHGWTGDENSMWIFSRRLPEDQLLIAPRGLHVIPSSGFSWHPHTEGEWPTLDDFKPAVEAVLGLLIPDNFPEGKLDQMRWVGFSQGAALIYTLAMLNPEKVISLAGLSGFFPEGAENQTRLQPLQDKPVFVAHGTQDTQVPVERARRSVSLLKAAGAQVTYCEDDVGHKLSATCFRGLENFFQRF